MNIFLNTVATPIKSSVADTVGGSLLRLLRLSFAVKIVKTVKVSLG
jgi:hypothetical protein